MKSRMLIASVAVGLIAAAGLGAPGLAQEEQKKVEKVERHVIVKHDGRHGAAAAKAGRHRDGTPFAQCSGEKVESDVAVGDDGTKHRTRIVICGDGESRAELNAKLAEALEKARDNIGDHDMSAERRAELRAAIEAEIARVRARN